MDPGHVDGAGPLLIDGHDAIEKYRHSEGGVFLWLRKGGYVCKKSLEVGESWAKYFEMYK
jgi:hypothetical protein